MPELDGLQATRRILAADDTARILILTTFDFDQYVKLHSAWVDEWNKTYNYRQ